MPLGSEGKNSIWDKHAIPGVSNMGLSTLLEASFCCSCLNERAHSFLFKGCAGTIDFGNTFVPSTPRHYFGVRKLDTQLSSRQHVTEMGLNHVWIWPWEPASTILWFFVPLILLKMRFHISFSYLVDTFLLDSARRDLKCFHLCLKIYGFLWLKWTCQKYQAYIYLYLHPESFWITAL